MIYTETYSEEDLKVIRKQLTDLESLKPPEWQQQAIELIRKSRFSNNDLEFKRLCFLNVFDAETLSKLISKVVKLVPLKEIDSEKEKRLALIVMIGRAIEIQRIYASTHYSFLHAQNSKWLVFSTLVKESMKVCCPDQDLQHFKCLRIPSDSEAENRVSAYSESEAVQDYEAKTRRDLISASAYFLHATFGESALYFASHNDSAMCLQRQLIQQAIKFFYRNLSEEEVLSYTERVVKLTNNDPSKVGNLFVLCIPKEKSSEMQYRAHPYGTPCRCHTQKEAQQILEKLQKGKLDAQTKCVEGCPQYRLFTPALTPQTTRIYSACLKTEYRVQVKQQICEIVRELQEKNQSKIERSFCCS